MAKMNEAQARKRNTRTLLCAVFMEEIDSMLTAEVASQFGLSTPVTYKILKSLTDKKIRGYTGRKFSMNGEGNDRGIKHSAWFFT